MIPVCEPLLGGDEETYVLDCLHSGWISSAGKYLNRFEREWAEYCDMQYGIAVSSGTAALQIALRILDLAPGDEVIMPTFTIISCAQAVVDCGAVPVLVDTDPQTWQMDVRQIESKITDNTRAIMAVHIYGHPVDMDPLVALSRAHGLTVIEDAAEAHGAEYHGKKCGGLSDLSVFSFYANKLITTGEGGMILTRSEMLAEKARSFRNLCFQKKRRFLHEETGYNYRMTNIQAALGVAQLARMEEIVAQKRAIAQAYSQRLQDVPEIVLPIEAPWAKNVYWVYGIVIKEDAGGDAAQMAARLAEVGIETRPFFLGMHEQPVFLRKGLFLNESYPVAERLAKQGLYLPSGLTLKESDIDTVCAAVQTAVSHKKESTCR